MKRHFFFTLTLVLALLTITLDQFLVAEVIPKDLKQYLKRASENNHGLKAAYEQWKAAETKPTQVGVLPDPRISFTYFIQEVETRVGPQKKKIGLSQKFPLGGKLKLKALKARTASKIDWQKLQVLKLMIDQKVKTAYFEYAYLERAIEISKEIKLLLTQLEEVAQVKYQSGTGSHSSIVQLHVELGKLENRINSMLDLRKARSMLLASELNEAETKKILPWPGRLEALRFKKSSDSLVKQLKLKNPEIKIYDYLAEVSRVEEKLARKKRVPDLTVGLFAVETGNRIDANPLDNGNDPYGVMFSFNLPVRSRAYAAAEKEARHRGLSARYKKRNRTESLLSELQLTLFKFDDSWRKIVLYKDSLIPKSEQAMQVSQEGFASGDVDFLNVIDSVRTILNFHLSYERAVIDQRIALARLETLVGHSLNKQLEIIPDRKVVDKKGAKK